MKNISKITLISILCFLATSILIGCSRLKEESIVTVGNNELTLEDFIYDIYLIETEGNSLNEYYYTNMGINYWDFERNGITMREAAKDTILTRVIMYELLNDQAKKAEIHLSEQELKTNEEAVDSFIQNTEEDLTRAGLNREILLQAYNKLTLGDKYYLELSKDFDLDENAIRESLSKEDYREYKTECLYVPTVSTENQQITSLTKEEVTIAYSLLEDALDKIKAGAEFSQIIKENDQITLYRRNFILKDDVPELNYREAAILLDNDEYSDIVATDFGYYIIHMLDHNSNDRYEKAIDEAIKAEQRVQFEAVYNSIKEQYPIKINTEYWNTIRIGFATNK